MKTFIVTTKLDEQGGVSNFYRMLQPYLGADFHLYQRFQSNCFLFKVILSILDYIFFVFSFIGNRYDCYFLNPSLVERAVLRDTIYAATVKAFHKKLVVFFHGWDLDFQRAIERMIVFPLFKKNLCDADLTFVLSKDFKEQLIRWGNKKKIEVTFTCYELSIVDEKRNIENTTPTRLLFLSRIEEAKGIFIVLKAFQALSAMYPSRFTLTIAGDGSPLASVKKYVKDNSIHDVLFMGYIRGEEKKLCLNSHHIFFFPSYYSEGLPCALLEAMACGLVIVTRNVGGIPGFFTKEMGLSTDSKDPSVFMEYILELSGEPETLKRISSYNMKYASEHFSAPEIAKRITDLIAQYVA